jgi:hypothetical protein
MTSGIFAQNTTEIMASRILAQGNGKETVQLEAISHSCNHN